MAELPNVQVGQVWADNDKRSKGRTVKVQKLLKVYDPFDHIWVPKAQVLDSRGRTTEIRVDRFRPTASGYRLVTEGGDQ